MGNTEKLMNQIMELKFTAKSLQRQARKCEKEEKEQKLKVKKAMEKGNMDGARIHAENAIRKRTEQMNYLRLSSRLDAVVARLDTQSKMSAIAKSMGSIVKSLDSSLATGNLQKMSETMDNFEKQFVNMEVQAEFMESSMAGSTSLSTPESDVNSLMQQVADDYGLEVSVGLPQPAAHAIPAKPAAEKVDEDDGTIGSISAAVRLGNSESCTWSERARLKETLKKWRSCGSGIYNLGEEGGGGVASSGENTEDMGGGGQEATEVAEEGSVEGGDASEEGGGGEELEGVVGVGTVGVVVGVARGEREAVVGRSGGGGDGVREVVAVVEEEDGGGRRRQRYSLGVL